MEGIEEKSSVDWQRWFFLAAGVLVVVGIIIGGIVFYRRSSGTGSGETSETTPTPVEQTVTQAPEPSPAVELDKTELTIKILNGTGIPGAANGMAEVLEAAGYEGIKTGNADNYDYQESIIQIKESKSAYLSLLTEDLTTDYTLAQESETLAEEEDFDVMIILGKN